MAYKKRYYLRFYLDVWPDLLGQLSDPLAGCLLRTIMKYAADGTIPHFANKRLAAVWPCVKASVDRDLAVHEAKQRRAEARYSATRKPKRSDDA